LTLKRVLAVVFLRLSGGVLAPNGKIYCLPYSGSKILELDPNTRTASTFGTVSGSYKVSVLAPNGKIIGIPSNASTILELDPVAKTTTTFGTVSTGGSWRYLGGVLGANGKIYAIPGGASDILEIDPDARTVTSVGGSVVSEVVPQNDNSSSFYKWEGGVLAPNGQIYSAPLYAQSILEIDTNTNPVSIRTFENAGSGTWKYSGVVLAPSGKLYALPMNLKTILEINISANPITTQTFEISELSTSTNFMSGTLGLNGKIYGIPYQKTKVIEIDPKGVNNFDPNIPLSGYYNKY
jgi:hypothetical protein